MKIVFSSGNTLDDLVIKIATFSHWCHVDLLFEDGTLIGATRLGVQKLTLEKRLTDKTIRKYRIDQIDLPYENCARKFAEDQIGKAYDYTALLALPTRGNWQQDDKWFCSELAAATIHQGGTQIFRDDAWRITPAHLDISPLLRTIMPTTANR